jgi:hypothetical protein
MERAFVIRHSYQHCRMGIAMVCLLLVVQGKNILQNIRKKPVQQSVELAFTIS